MATSVRDLIDSAKKEVPTAKDNPSRVEKLIDQLESAARDPEVPAAEQAECTHVTSELRAALKKDFVPGSSFSNL